jgi:hypothetical protein
MTKIQTNNRFRAYPTHQAFQTTEAHFHPYQNKMGKKDILARMLCFGGLCERIRAIRAKSSKVLHILTYHRVCDLFDEGQYDFNTDLVSASETEFRWQMEYVKQRYEVINFTDLQKLLLGSISIFKPPLIVTFDDGYQDNFNVAQEILFRKKMTEDGCFGSIVFISTLCRRQMRR